MSTSTVTSLITDAIGDLGAAMFVVLGAFLGIAVSYLVFKFGWRKTKGAVR